MSAANCSLSSESGRSSSQELVGCGNKDSSGEFGQSSDSMRASKRRRASEDTTAAATAAGAAAAATSAQQTPASEAAAPDDAQDNKHIALPRSFRSWDNKAQVIRQHIALSKHLRTVFGSANVEVDLCIIIDGQLVPQSTRLVLPLGSSQAARPVYIHSSHKSGLSKYVGYLITRYTAESPGSTTTTGGPKLTLYLKSPAVQQQGQQAVQQQEQAVQQQQLQQPQISETAGGAVVEEDAEGWVTSVCRQTNHGPRTTSNYQLYITQQFLDRAFPGLQHDGLHLQVTIVEDESEKSDIKWRGTVRYKSYVYGPYNTKAQRPYVLINAATAAALAGSRIQRLRAKAPNMLQIFRSTSAGSREFDQALISSAVTEDSQSLAALPIIPPPGAAAAAAAAVAASVEAPTVGVDVVQALESLQQQPQVKLEPQANPAAALPLPATEGLSHDQAEVATQAGAAVQPVEAVAVAPATAAAACSAAQQQQQIPGDLVLPDYDDSNILLVGQHLTKLLDHLQADDHDLMRLDEIISVISDLSDHDDHRLARFRYHYSRLQVWVRRKNVDQAWKTLKQLLDSGAGS